MVTVTVFDGGGDVLERLCSAIWIMRCPIRWSERNFCKNVKFTKFMLSNCAKSCDDCGDDGKVRAWKINV